MLRSFLVLIMAAGMISGCASFKSGYRIQKEEFRATVKRVAVAPVRVTLDILLPGNLDERASWNGRATVDEAVRPTLTSCGFEVVPREAAMEVIERRVEQVGVAPDPLGRVKKEELLKWRSAVMDALDSQESTRADAVVFPVLAYRRGKIRGSVAGWDGMVEECRAFFDAAEVVGGELGRQAASGDGVSLVVEVYRASSAVTAVWYGSALISALQVGKDYKYDSSGVLGDDALIQRAAAEALVSLDRSWVDPRDTRSSSLEERAP